MSENLLVFDRELLRERDYWLSRLTPESLKTCLPLDYPRRSGRQQLVEAIALEIEGDLMRRLDRLTSGSPFLTYIVLATALGIVLSRYTSISQPVVGSPARRSDEDHIETSNVVPLLLEIDQETSFRDLLMVTRSIVLEAYSSQRYPFKRLIKDLGLGGNENGFPLFGIALGLRELHWDLPEVGNDVTFYFERRDETLFGSVRYDAAILRQDTLTRIIRNYLSLLHHALNDPKASINALEWMSPAEQSQILREWNDTLSTFPYQGGFHEIFECRTKENPDTIAVACGARQVSYLELSLRSNYLAHQLLHLGVKWEDVVAIAVESTDRAVQGMLGILKAGAAFLPLDPDYPAERLQFMLEDAGARLVLSEAGCSDRLPESTECGLLRADEWWCVGRGSTGPPAIDVSPANVAYVIYTSGSTGKPKGAMLTHRGLCNLQAAQRRCLALSRVDRVLQFSSWSFDASVFDVVMALGVGSTLCGKPRECLLPGPPLVDVLRREKISNLTIPPSALAATPLQGGLALQTLVVAGEACSADLVGRWSPGRRFFNAYGPTETTVWATVALCSDRASKPSIGLPIDNMQVFLLGRWLNPAPIGVPAQLHIKGMGVARGYLGRPALTAETFIPYPFGGQLGGRIYCTGDQARRLSCGELDFLGRVDDQVKVRGYRIETGEVAEVLRGHPAVRDCAVIASQGLSGDLQLVAYCVSDMDPPPSSAEFRRHLGHRLPNFMVPSAFVALEQLPRLPSGKLDRRALPTLASLERPSEMPFVAPRNPFEELVAAILSELLGLKRIGVHENFFVLGGHSLLATQAMSRAAIAIGVELPLRTIFENPTVEGLAARFEAAKATGETLRLAPIEKLPQKDRYQLSFAQRRLWFLDQLMPGSSVYNIFAAIRMAGVLYIEALRLSLDRVRERHGTLRTTFCAIDGLPFQIIAPPTSQELSMVDCSALEEAVSEQAVRDIAAWEAERPFDLGKESLLRVLVVRLGQREHAVLVTMHHIISDGWSMGVLVREIATLYEAYCLGRPDPLPELPLQYVDFAHAQQRWLTGPLLQQQLDYWKRQLGDGTSILKLPYDRPRPQILGDRGDNVQVALPDDLDESMMPLCMEQRSTPFMTLLSAFYVLLHRYTAEKDIAVGSPIANRNRADIENLIGYFVNTLILRVEVSGKLSFRELIARTREVTLGAFSHQELPFERLVEEINPQRSMSHSPLFQVVFSLEHASSDRLDLPGLQATAMWSERQTTKRDLTLSLSEDRGELTGNLGYSTDLFDRISVERMSHHLRTLLDCASARPDLRLSELSMLRDAERHQLIREWGGAAGPPPAPRLVHERFEDRVKDNPDAFAVRFEDQQWTYRELDRKATRLAHLLHSRGVGPEVLVGICIPPSFESVVALLGILKAGGAYLGVDPDLPRKRLEYILTDSGVKLLVTVPRHIETISGFGCACVTLDSEWEILSGQCQSTPVSSVDVHNLAYLIYTSGSTGLPKGVAGEHRQLLVYLDGILPRLAPSPGDTFAVHQSLAVDAPITYLFGALVVGGCISLIHQQLASDAGHLRRFLDRWPIDYLKVAPSHLSALLAMEETRWTVSPRLALLGGEALHRSVVAKLMDFVPGCLVVNHYGPTEATVGVLTHSIEALPESDSDSIMPLGRPLAGPEIYVLDQWLHPLAAGLVGELHIGGPGLSRGYFRRPHVTAPRFIPNPFSVETGARLYRSGDMVRLLTDGSFDFVGRLDHQVKIRGFRVELGEIEAVLGEHPDVPSVVVVADTKDESSHRLIAYVSSRRSSPTTVAQLRSYLEDRLPHYMIPSVFVLMDSLPRTPQGKIDRRALPAAERTRPEMEVAFVPPETPNQKTLAAIWIEVMGVEKVGLNDDFFDLGGHSLLATRIVSRARRDFEVDIPLRSLFERPTVAGLVRTIEEIKQTNPGFEEPEIRPVSRRGRRIRRSSLEK